jgi:hypothetical protein
MLCRWRNPMNLKYLFVAVPAALCILGSGVAKAGQTISEEGALACVNDKWDVKEPEKGHKLIDYAGRCMKLPSDPAAAKVAMDCAGNYEYMPDGTWKGAGTCTRTYKDGSEITDAWEEGSQLKESTYKIIGGTGKYEGATGGGTYALEELTDTLLAGPYKGTMQLP